MNKIYLENIYENRWEFKYPDPYYTEDLYVTFEKGISLIDFDDFAAEKVFKNIIKKYPYHIDSYTHLSLVYRNQEKYLESFVFAEKAYNLGKEIIPETFNIKIDTIEWSLTSNRPFLRACQVYAMEFYYNDQFNEAINLFNLILSLNKNDNQGIRYPLFEIYLKTGKYNEARKLLKQNLDEQSIDFSFGKVVLDIIEDKIDKNLKNLKIAKKSNTYLYEELIKSDKKFYELKSLDKIIDKMELTPGSIYEAYEYWLKYETIYSIEKVKNYFNVNRP